MTTGQKMMHVNSVITITKAFGSFTVSILNINKQKNSLNDALNEACDEYQRMYPKRWYA